MLQLNHDQLADDNGAAAAVQALSNALSMNQTNSSSSALAVANALRLNNGLDALAKISNSSSTNSFKQTNGSINLVNSSLSISPVPDANSDLHASPEAKRTMLKKSNNERKYPCGFPGCNWIFTRSNHVVRHQRRIHGLKVEMKAENGPRRSSGSQIASHRGALGFKSAAPGHLRGQLTQPNLQLMLSRKLLHLKDEFPTRLSSLPIKRTFSKNSLLNSSLLCNGNPQLSRPKLANSLNQHRTGQQQLKIGNIRRFQCDVDDCGQKFSSELMFNNHLKLMHNVNRNLINKHSVNLNSGTLPSSQQAATNTQNTSLNNLNSMRNTVQNPGSQIINLLASQSQQQQQQSNNPAKPPKTNMNNINNHIKLFLSNKTVNQVEGQDSFHSYINNLNANLKLKLLQFKGNNTSVTVNNLVTGNGNVVQQPPQLNITKVSAPTPATTISLPKVILPVTTLGTLGTLNLPTTTIASQPNKPLFITQIQLPTGGGQLITNKLLTNAAVIQQTASAKGHVIYQCDIKSCIKRFNTKDNLVDHLFDEHNAFEPEVVVRLESSDENWMLLEDPKRLMVEEPDIGQPLAKSSDSNQQDYRPCRIARSSNEPSLATTLGIVKDVVQRVDNVNTLNNIAATSSTTYSGLNKTHVCNIKGCTKSFSKRYHLVRHRLEAHQVGKLSLMQDILNEKNGQELNLDLLNVNTSTTDRLPPPKIKKKENTPIPKLVIKNISTTPVASSSLTTPFYMRRPPADYRPYPCRYPKCGWSFKRAYHLKRHCRTHNHYFADCPEEPPKDWKMPPEDEEDDEDLDAFDDNIPEISPELSENDEEKDDEPVLQIAEDDEMIVDLEEKEVNEEVIEDVIEEVNEEANEESKCEEIQSEQIEAADEDEKESEQVQTEVQAIERAEIEVEPVIKAKEVEKKVEVEKEAKSKAESDDEIEAVQEVKEELQEESKPVDEKPAKELARPSCKVVQPIIVRKVTRSASIELQQQLQINKEREIEAEPEKPASKAESKPESKSESKAEMKAENKAEIKTDNKTENKTDSKTESKTPESSRNPLRRAPDTRRSTRQGVKQEQTITDEDQSSCEVSTSSDPQLLRCEFSHCKLTFRRKRQYDLHIKTHLAEKSTKRPRHASDEQRPVMPPNHRTSSNSLSANEPTVNSNDENSSEELYTIAEQAAAPASTRTYRTSRTRRGCHDLNNNLSLELDGKPDSPQLLLLCNAKDMIFYPNELKTRGKGKLQNEADQ